MILLSIDQIFPMDSWTQAAMISRTFLVDYPRRLKATQVMGRSQQERLWQNKVFHEMRFNGYMWNNPDALFWMDWVTKPKEKDVPAVDPALAKTIKSPGKQLASGLFLYDSTNVDNPLTVYDDSSDSDPGY